MTSEGITDKLFAALNILVVERLDNGSFAAIGDVPDWFVEFYPDAASRQEQLRLEIKFPFLENFLIDAENFWAGNDAQQLKSGIWSEGNILGNICNLEATALRWQNRKILLIESLKTTYEEKLSLIQTARENNLNYYNLVKEIQKKEVLLHCIVHDLAGQFTAIHWSLELLELEDLTSQGRERLEIAKRQCVKQQMLVREILDAFSAEIESLETFTFDPVQAPDAAICAKEVVDALLPTFSTHKMHLQLAANIDMTVDWRVVGEKSRLERILSNLVENAFRHSLPGSSVTVQLQEDGEHILFAVDDEGTGVPPDLAKNLFQKFSQGKHKSGRTGLGLYFCRITVERWGGTIGYSSRSESGSRFWFRLPKAVC